MRLIAFIIVLHAIAVVRGQEKIRLRKEDSTVLFFQKGEARDTIAFRSGDLFYLIANDSVLPALTIIVENGCLQPTSNDSLFRLVYIPGHRYECECRTQQRNELQGTRKKAGWKCYVDGPGTESLPGISILMRLRNRPEPLLRNRFIYRR